MKPSPLLLATLSAALSAAGHAGECALVTLRTGKEKTVQQFAFELHEGDAPQTVENFKKLARKGFYEGCDVHRAFPDLLVQMGDPLSRKGDRHKVGTGGPGYSLAPEIRRKHTKGAVAAARLPDKLNPTRLSNGSQFFVCLSPMPSYDGQYTVFGTVVSGLDTLSAISDRPTDSNDYPVERVRIQSVKIMPREQLPPPPKPAAPSDKPEKRWWQIFG